MSNVFFTADNHFYHDAIRRHCNRPFDTVEEMNEAMIENWNSVVGRGDVVHVLGDFFWFNDVDMADSLLNRLNGNKHLYVGNHDRKGCVRSKKWACVKEIGDIRVDGQPIVLCHYPLMSWRKKVYEAWMLHGHCHGNLRRSADFRNIDWDRQLILDVGVDEWNFTPVAFETVRELMEMRTQRFKTLNWRNVGNSIPIMDCHDNHLYWIDARNSSFGIFNKKDSSFTIRRIKFNDIYLFDEYHYDTGRPHGTVKPYQMLERCPDFESDAEKLAYLEAAEERFDTSPHEDLELAVNMMQNGHMMSSKKMSDETIAKIGLLYNIFPDEESRSSSRIMAATLLPLAIQRVRLGLRIDKEFFNDDEYCMVEFKRRLAVEMNG